MDNEKFLTACQEVLNHTPIRKGIGTLGEKTLHAVLKQYFENHTENHEVKIGSYVADIISESGIIEIQTQGFNKLRNKLEAFLEYAPVTIVYPIAQTKWLCWVDRETGEVTQKRKSPKKGSIYDAFFELYKIKYLLRNPNLKICFVLLELTEYRYLDGWSQDKKKGSSRCDRIPCGIIDKFWIHSPYDYQQMIPDSLSEQFTTKDYALHTKLNLRSAQTALNVLLSVGAVEKIGKAKRLYIYKRA